MSNPQIPPTNPNKETTNPLRSLPDYYEHYWNVILFKYNKDDQALIAEGLKAPVKKVRGHVQQNPLVRDFLRSVAEKAEEEFDKAQKIIKI